MPDTKLGFNGRAQGEENMTTDSLTKYATLMQNYITFQGIPSFDSIFIIKIKWAIYTFYLSIYETYIVYQTTLSVRFDNEQIFFIIIRFSTPTNTNLIISDFNN